MNWNQLPRRKRLMILYTLASAAAVLLAGTLLFTLGSRPEPYLPGDEVEGITRSLDRALPSDAPAVRFVDVTGNAGIVFHHFSGTRSTQLPEDMGSGAAWGDYDGDGDFDLYLCNFAAPLTVDPASAPSGNHLYRNNGDGTFTNVTEAVGLAFKGWSLGASWGDYDGDGDLDLFVTNYGTNLLYRNDGSRFTEVTPQAGLELGQGFWAGASWADYDLDGDLDLYVCGYVQYRFNPEDLTRRTFQYKADVPFTLNPSSYPPERNLLYRNNGNGTFSEVAREAGVDNPTGRSLAAAWCDFDLDGWPDLYVANDISDNALFRNLGNGRFEDISHQAWVADYRGAMGLGIGDWDNDGDSDIFVTHWIAQENALYNNLTYAFDSPDARAPQLLFMDIADQVGLGQIALDYIGWGTSFFDYDNDGKLDLFVVNGSTFQDKSDPTRLVPMRSLLFWNRGEEEGFFEVGRTAGGYFQQARVGRGASWADYDGDGDVDLFVVNHGGLGLLLQNQGGNSQNWIKVRLKGEGKNRFGVGARIELRSGQDRQLQEMGAQPSYLSQNALEAHFGLGSAPAAEELIVTFPGGAVVRRQGIPANTTIWIEEPR